MISNFHTLIDIQMIKHYIEINKKQKSPMWMVSNVKQMIRDKSYIPSEHHTAKKHKPSRITRIQKQMFINIMFPHIYFLIYYQR